MNIQDIKDLTRTPQKRGDALLQAVDKGDITLEFLVDLMSDKEEYVRSAVAQAFSRFKKAREAYTHLLTLLRDPGLYVRCDTLLSLGALEDSRATFPLINYFEHVNYEEQKRVIFAFEKLRDPRAVGFLLQHFEDSNGIDAFAKQAYTACASNSDFEYTFAGPEELWEPSLEDKQARILLAGSYMLDKAQVFIERYGFDRPQTYIVDKRGMWIGGILGEHVDVARGKKVLAAGEVIFRNEGAQWEVDYINNRSNGYYPDPISFVHVRKALESSGIRYEEEHFSETYPKEGFFCNEFLQFHLFYKDSRR